MNATDLIPELLHLDVANVADQLLGRIATATWAKLTFEQRQDVIAYGLRAVGAHIEERSLRELTTDAELIEIEGVAYRRLRQPSSTEYFGMWGSYRIEEALYRQAGMRNGPTIKPLEKRAGMVTKSMTPMLARTLGEMQADMTSREAAKRLRRLGLGSGERAYVADHVHRLEVELADQVDELEQAAREAEKLPEGVASISCGMDRRSIPMEEDRPVEQPPKTDRRVRRRPYVRKKPGPIDVNYRMAYVGTVSLVDEDAQAIRTMRYTMEADGDAQELAKRIRAEVEGLLGKRPSLPISIVQDGAKELEVLREELLGGAAADTTVHDLVDYQHLLGYLDAVVAACEPPDDPHNMKRLYRGKLLHEDRGIDHIFPALRRRARNIPNTSERSAERKALARALSYIRDRRGRMRYAAARRANLFIGSGATESTCKLIGQRTNRSGARWRPPGVRGTMAVRSLVLSERWDHAWAHYARSKLSTVTPLSLAQ